MNFNSFGATVMFSISLLIHTSRRSVNWLETFSRQCSIAFSQRCRSTLYLIEDKTFNDSDIINNLIDYEGGYEEPHFFEREYNISGIQLSNESEKHFVKIDTYSERSLKFQKELRSCISGYRDVHNRPSSQKFITYFMVQKKSVEIVSSSDESDF
ncbi:uncharacterized protein TNCV_2993611 [Trichonephila clavipes]|nr:uncharacterized protein TNCV_2993611 [Trichonephila clavipes]